MASVKTSKLQAVATSKCPKCRVGKMFVGHTYGLKIQRFNDICPHCAFRFEIEPGYFYAAMYISYAMVVIQVLVSGLLTYEITKSESPWTYLGTLTIAIFMFAPFNFRYSRLILLHYLTPKVHYDPKYEQALIEEIELRK